MARFCTMLSIVGQWTFWTKALPRLAPIGARSQDKEYFTLATSQPDFGEFTQPTKNTFAMRPMTGLWKYPSGRPTGTSQNLYHLRFIDEVHSAILSFPLFWHLFVLLVDTIFREPMGSPLTWLISQVSLVAWFKGLTYVFFHLVYRFHAPLHRTFNIFIHLLPLYSLCLHGTCAGYWVKAPLKVYGSCVP